MRIIEIVEDIDGRLSSKRVAALSAVVAMIVLGSTGLASDTLVNGLRDVALAGLAVTIPERLRGST